MLRLRVKFSRGEEVKFISHLDIMRLWERAMRRADVPLAYSEGLSPHLRLSLAAPLPVGITSEAELMDLLVVRDVSPHWFSEAVNRQLPPGIRITGVYSAAESLPSLQSLVRFAEYKVAVETDKPASEIESLIFRFLDAERLPWSHRRDTGERKYDLRALVDDLWMVDCQPASSTLGMRLRCDSGGSGRPEQVVLALGFNGYPRSMHRTRLILEV